MNYQKIVLVGNATANAEQKKSKKGDVSFTTFGVGVSDSNEHTTFFPITVFGKHGAAVAKYVTKGSEVLVEGRIQVSEKGYFNVVASRVVFGTLAQKSAYTKKKPTTAKKTAKKAR